MVPLMAERFHAKQPPEEKRNVVNLMDISRPLYMKTMQSENPPYSTPVSPLKSSTVTSQESLVPDHTFDTSKTGNSTKTMRSAGIPIIGRSSKEFDRGSYFSFSITDDSSDLCACKMSGSVTMGSPSPLSNMATVSNSVLYSTSPTRSRSSSSASAISLSCSPSLGMRLMSDESHGPHCRKSGYSDDGCVFVFFSSNSTTF
jgi:hypothetical protein